MKLYGYIEPPFSVIDFVPVVYKEGEDFYSTVVSNHIITDFYRISPYTEMKEILRLNIQKKVNEPAFYCYMDPDGKEIYGEYIDISPYLFDILTDNHLNYFAKLSIAYFVKLVGLQKTLIDKINKKYTEINPDFILLEIKQKSTEIENNLQFKLILKYIDYWQNEIERSQSKLFWKDVLYSDGAYIYLNSYCIPVDIFIKIPVSKSILINYLTSLGQKERRNLELTNNDLFNTSLDYCPKTPLSIDEVNNLTDTLMSPYEIEEFYGSNKIHVLALFNQSKMSIDNQNYYSKKDLKDKKVKYTQLQLSYE